MNSRKVAILGGTRLPFARSGGKYREISVLDLIKASLKATVDKYGLKGQRLDDVALGTVFFPPSEWNLAREAVLHSGLSPDTPAQGIQRACATGLDAAISIAGRIALGQLEVGIAGGGESLSNPPVYYRPQFARRIVQTAQSKDWKGRLSAWSGISLGEMKPGTAATVEPTSGKSMGEHCELMAQEWKISRQDQDAFALKSHQTGAKAYKDGFYDDLVVPFEGLKRDNNLRDDTTLDKMAKLKPAFERSAKGTLTAGNSSPLTDGASCVLLSSEAWAKEHGMEPLAYLTDFQSSAVDIRKEGLLMAPAYAVPTMLDRHQLSLQDFDIYEIHEAFAAQVLCTLRAWESADFCTRRLGRKAPLGSIPMDKINLFGGSVALGHPFGATGGRMLATAAKGLKQKGSGRALLSICAGGGMGTVAILER